MPATATATVAAAVAVAVAFAAPMLALALLGAGRWWMVLAACAVGVVVRLAFRVHAACDDCECAPCEPTPCVCPVGPVCMPGKDLDLNADKTRDVLDAFDDNGDLNGDLTDDPAPSPLVFNDPAKLGQYLFFSDMQSLVAHTKYHQAAPGSVDSYKALSTLSRVCASMAVLHATRYLTVAEAKAQAQRVGTVYKQLLEYDKAAQAATSVADAKKAAEAAQNARFECQDLLLKAMTASTDPIRKVKAPKQPKPPRKPEKCSKDAQDLTTPLNTHQKNMLKFLLAKAQELLVHLLDKYPNDPMTKDLNAHWTRQMTPMNLKTAPTGGVAYMAAYGQPYGQCMVINMFMIPCAPRALTGLLHELGHIANMSNSTSKSFLAQGGHTKEFYAVHRRLLQIAATELKWTLELSCRETCDLSKDPNNKDPNKICPGCIWQRTPPECEALAKDELCRPVAK